MPKSKPKKHFCQWHLKVALFLSVNVTTALRIIEKGINKQSSIIQAGEFMLQFRLVDLPDRGRTPYCKLALVHC
jgi:hypothetical protein